MGALLAVAAALGVSALALNAALQRYAPTETDADGDGAPGPNVFTAEGAINVLRIMAHIDRALAAVRGSLHSCFRSPAINKKVGGVQPSPKSPRGSRHLRGLAADIKPHVSISLDEAMGILYGLAVRSELGPVTQLIKETSKGIVHISWAAVGEHAPLRPQLIEQPSGPGTDIPYTIHGVA